jgi:hypothetical protein
MMNVFKACIMRSFLFQDFKWLVKELWEKAEKYALLPFFRIPTETPNLYSRVLVQKNVAIPMRDGVRLYADIYKPETEGKFPVVLIRMPYGKSEFYCYMPAVGKYWAKKGYACVIQDVRGKWASEGKWEPFFNEANDGYDTLDWVAAQPWCDGNIGMTGESYYGYTQWAVAALNHPNLKCIAPGDTAANIYGVWVYAGGQALCMQTLGMWVIMMNSRTYRNYFRLNQWHLPLISIDDGAGLRCESYKDWIKHPTRDDYWNRINLDHKYSAVKIPVLNWGGWYDVFLKATIDDWTGLTVKAESDAVRRRHRLLIAPTDHETTPLFTGRIGRLNVGKQVLYDRIQRFFDFWLKGVQNGLPDEPQVEMFVMGENKWRHENEWPPKRVQYVKYYLHSHSSAATLHGDGTLNTTIPGKEPVDTYIYDPENPVIVALKTDLWRLAKYMKNRTEVETRRDVLVYTSSVTEADLEITGPIIMTLYAGSSARDTDFTATLVDVFPDGYAQMIQEGIVRARHRDMSRPPSLIEPGTTYEYKIDLWATSYILKSGHRIRVEISSSNFNRYDRNLNSEGEFGSGSKIVKATQTISHDADYPSHITLPIIPRGDA